MNLINLKITSKSSLDGSTWQSVYKKIVSESTESKEVSKAGSPFLTCNAQLELKVEEFVDPGNPYLSAK